MISDQSIAIGDRCSVCGLLWKAGDRVKVTSNDPRVRHPDCKPEYPYIEADRGFGFAIEEKIR